MTKMIIDVCTITCEFDHKVWNREYEVIWVGKNLIFDFLLLKLGHGDKKFNVWDVRFLSFIINFINYLIVNVS